MAASGGAASTASSQQDSVRDLIAAVLAKIDGIERTLLSSSDERSAAGSACNAGSATGAPCDEDATDLLGAGCPAIPGDH